MRGVLIPPSAQKRHCDASGRTQPRHTGQSLSLDDSRTATISTNEKSTRVLLPPYLVDFYWRSLVMCYPITILCTLELVKI